MSVPREPVTRQEATERAVYVISVAAKLTGVHPQTLRIYEQKGLIAPLRTSGNTRRYSDDDIQRLRAIQRLTEGGLNLAGVKRVMELEAELDRLRLRLQDLQEQLEHRRAIAMPGRRIGAQIVPLGTAIPQPWGPPR